MCSDSVIRVENLSKCYQIYDSPRDRLKQFVVPRAKRLLGRVQPPYYKEFWALRDVSFEVQKGESIGILGRNGSGKSTLLQIITGTLTPTSGIAQTQGRIAALLELGSGFNPEFSGRDNAYMNGALLGLSREQMDEKFDAIASFADIGDFMDQPVKTYSSGMMVRLAFAVQVQVEPDILIVDEALAVGDALFQKRCFQRIEKLLSDGVTLLFVSHDIESIRTLTHKSLLLNRGRTVNWGVSSEVVLDYRKLLHDAESEYFSAITQQVAQKAATQSEQSPEGSQSNGQIQAVSAEDGASKDILRSDKLSFGDAQVEVVSVTTLNENDEASNVFYPRDRIKIKVVCRSHIDTDKLNVGIRIRNKEGVKIYSWGTLNQDMEAIARNEHDALFWHRKVNANEQIEVVLECECTLGENLYEIQASVSHEETPNYLNQRILHWRDEAAFFQVLLNRQDYFFGGIIDMKMKAGW